MRLAVYAAGNCSCRGRTRSRRSRSPRTTSHKAVDGVHLDIDGEQVVTALGAMTGHEGRTARAARALQPPCMSGDDAMAVSISPLAISALGLQLSCGAPVPHAIVLADVRQAAEARRQHRSVLPWLDALPRGRRPRWRGRRRHAGRSVVDVAAPTREWPRAVRRGGLCAVTASMGMGDPARVRNSGGSGSPRPVTPSSGACPPRPVPAAARARWSATARAAGTSEAAPSSTLRRKSIASAPTLPQSGRWAPPGTGAVYVTTDPPPQPPTGGDQSRVAQLAIASRRVLRLTPSCSGHARGATRRHRGTPRRMAVANSPPWSKTFPLASLRTAPPGGSPRRWPALRSNTVGAAA